MKHFLPPHIRAFLVLFLICVCSYFNTLQAPFQYDGVPFLQKNPYITSLAQEEDYKAFFFEHYAITRIGNRPVLNHTYALNYYLGKDRTFGYHLIDIGIHFGSCLFIYLIIWKILLLFGRNPVIPTRRNINVPLVAALLFASHPVQTQAIAYIMSRSASLCTFLYLASFYCFLLVIEAEKNKSAASATRSNLFMGGMILLSLLLMLLALGVKPIIFSLPLMMLVCFFLFSDSQKNIKSFVYRNKLPLGIILAPLLVFVLHQIIFAKGGLFLNRNDLGPTIYSRSHYFLSQITWFVFYYLKIWLFPFNLNIDPDIRLITNLIDIRLVAAVFVLVLLVMFARKQSLPVVFGFLWMIITLAPESSFVPLLDLVAEHRLYLPGVGFVLIIATLFRDGKWTPFHILLIVCLTTGAIHRNQDWTSEKALWQDAVKKSPKKWRPLSNHALTLYLAGDRDGAIRAYQKAIKMDAGHFQPHNNLGIIYAQMGNCILAIKEYNEALRLFPELPESLTGIGKCHKVQGDYDQAIHFFKRAIEANPLKDEPYRELGFLYYIRLNDKETGAYYLRQATKLNANDPNNASIEKMLADR